MPLSCPKCGSRELRPSRYQNTRERLDAYRFISPLRCRDCRTRFISRTIFPEDIFYARCPKCDRMDLSAWSGKRFEPEGLVKLKVILGAHQWRCEYCRVNFASFRQRKEVFTFARWKNRNPDSVAEKSGEPNAAPQADPEPKS